MPLPGTARTRRLVALPIAAVVALALATTVLAHAELVSSTPAANAVLAVAPEAVSLTFSEPIDPASAVVDLVDPQQREIEGVGDVGVSADGLVGTAPLPDLAPGVYTVRYQVVSAVDGHATAGILAFLVDPGGTEVAPTTPPSSSSPSVDLPTVLARWLGLASVLVAFGSLVMWCHAGRPALRDRAPGAPTGPPWGLVAAAAGLAFVGLSAYLVLSARPIVAAVGGQGFALDPAAPFGWTSFAIAMRIALAGTLLAAVASLSRIVGTRGRRPGADRAFGPAVAGLLLVALGGMSMAGHAAAGGLAFGVLDWIHLVTVAAWLGGLPAAFLLARRGPPVATPARTVAGAILRRHGRLAIVAAPVVALTGIANSPVLLGSARDLVASDYGNLVLAKAGLLGVAVGIGAVNHFVLRGRGRAAIGSLVAVELVVAILAIGAAATMVTIQPAASRQPTIVTQQVNPVHLYGTVGPSSVHLSVSVPAPGEQTYQASVADLATGAPRDDIQLVFLELTPPVSSGLPTEGRVELAPSSTPGVYGTTGAHTPVVGEWTVDLVLRRRGALDERLSFALPVTSPPEPEEVPPPDTGQAVPGPIAALWPLLPPGPLAWLPVLAALGGVWGLGRSRAPEAVRWTARGMLVGVVLVAGAAAGSRDLVAAANAPPALPAIDVPTDPAALGRGEALYLANCASCHGREGDGDGPIRTLPPPGPLGDAVRRTSAAELGYRIATGVAGTPMPAFAGMLTEAERRDLVGYLRATWIDAE